MNLLIKRKASIFIIIYPRNIPNIETSVDIAWLHKMVSCNFSDLSVIQNYKNGIEFNLSSWITPLCIPQICI